MVYQSILSKVGNTPLVHMQDAGLEQVKLYAKMEGFNPTGSVKDRSAAYILEKLLRSGTINQDTILIESSSGNFGVALSSYCKSLGLNFWCVVDPNISPENEMIIRRLSDNLIKVTEPDHSGGYLLTRIAVIQRLLRDLPNCYWINQYGNPLNAEAYYNSLGTEICEQLEGIDYVFLGVSSGGTLAGTSRKVKERYPKAQIIAVDMQGSVIFGGIPRKRHIPGIGSSMVPDILKQALYDDVILVDEVATIEHCHRLLTKHYMYTGGSSGSVYAAVRHYFAGRVFPEPPNVVMIFPDRGERYASTIYNEAWCDSIYDQVNKLETV
ncbi:2,3-diaminopropionate biosynthesis protein SbnA [Paenibacillus puerhi]|uniref:2,3-diaminopropionate biosynthesis protein SbnA n=1 Tax=Paenibacillus puerhi TaxID=2692622 RepID=UPI0013591F20|nr:2,3-diaminopropionate biosynthesis protein SbnA [Paenibacillus puerhi]